MKGHYKIRKVDLLAFRRSKTYVPYTCNHPLFNKCTLFTIPEFEGYGLGVIQQRFNFEEKLSWWGPIDACVAMDIYKNKKFYDFFISHADKPLNDIYPTIEVRRLMYALGMKPIPKEYWECNLNSQKNGLL